MNIPAALNTILGEYEQVFSKINQEMLNDFTRIIKAHDRIFCIGVGREGMATRAFAMRLMHMGKEVHWIWDDTTPNIGRGDLLLATAGGGYIGHIHYVCEIAKAAGATLAVATGSPSGKTAQMADFVLFVPAAVYRGTDPVVSSIQPMGNLFEQCLLIMFDVIVMQIVETTPGLTFEKMSERHRNVE